MVGWQHRLNGHESEQTAGVRGGQRSLARSPWAHKESDTAEPLNSNPGQNLGFGSCQTRASGSRPKVLIQQML